MSADSERNRALVLSLTEAIWNRRELERIPEFYSPDYVVDYRPYAPLREGHDAIRGMVERAWAAFPDYHEEIREIVADDARVAVRFTVSGTQAGQWGLLPPTGKRVEFDEVVFFELENGKVTRQSGVSDNLTALRQLGVLPSPPD